MLRRIVTCGVCGSAVLYWASGCSAVLGIEDLGSNEPLGAAGSSNGGSGNGGADASVGGSSNGGRNSGGVVGRGGSPTGGTGVGGAGGGAGGAIPDASAG